jgi:hypothetical protein
MQRVKLHEHTARAGAAAQEGWRLLSAKHRLKITVAGWPALCIFSLDYGSDAQALRTLLTQEMLDRGYLANAMFYPTLAHTPDVLRSYLSSLDEVFEILASAVAAGDVASRLRGPVAHSGFARLT